MESARQACLYYLARLRGEVDRLSALTYPGHHHGPKQWLAIVGGVIDTAVGYLETAADPLTPDLDASALIRDAERLGGNAYDLLQHAHGADASGIPHQIVGPFRRWVDGLGITNTIFFRADHVANYELATFDLRPYIRNINSPAQTLIDAGAAVDWPFRRVTVPSQAMGILPHFAIIGHELGHAIQDQIKIDISPYGMQDADSVSRTEHRLRAAGLTFTPQDNVKRTKIALSWINELKSDAVGHYLAGPALFFALAAFLELTGHGWGLGETHPPSELRRKLLFDRLSSGSPSYSDVFEKHTGVRLAVDMNSPHIDSLPPPDDLFRALSPKLGVVTAAICVELIPLLEALADDIFRGAEAFLGSANAEMIYDPRELDADLGAHLAPLRTLIPPIEARTAAGADAASLAGILNVGWAALTTQLPAIPSPSGGNGANDVTRKMEMVHELLLKGVELSEARRLWEEY